MDRMKNLLNILNSYSVLLNNLGVQKKNIRELDTLIKVLEEKENLEFKNFITAVKNIDSKINKNQKISIYEVGNIYRKMYAGKSLPSCENQLIANFDSSIIQYYLDMDEQKFKQMISRDSNEIKSIEYLKLILYLRYDMEFKGNKSRKNIISEACSLISHKKYYENMETAYKVIE